MYIKNLFFLACLLISTLLGANNHPIAATSFVPLSSDGGPCNLPAPFNFHISEVGPTWVRYEWSGNAAYQHRLRTYRASDNALLNTTTVPAGTASALIDNLPYDTEVYGIINAICTDGSHSPNEAQSAPAHTVILELIVNGIQAPEGETDGCNFTGPLGGICNFSGNASVVTNFRISNIQRPSVYRIFGMRFVSPNHFYCYLQNDNSEDGSLFDLTCESLFDPQPNPECQALTRIKIWNTGSSPAVELASFYCAVATETSPELYYSSGNSNYQLHKLNTYPYSGGRPSNAITNRNDAGIQNTDIASISPNPFSGVLEVFPAHPGTEKIQLQLYSLSGQKVLEQKFPGGQEQYRLSTASLSPGFYFLRIEADGVVQTLKVIKSE